MKFIDNFLNSITMYRLVLYVLTAFWIIAAIFSLLNLLPFNFISLLLTTAFILAICWLTNTFFGKIFKVPTNIESVYITSFILALIITPSTNFHDFWFLIWVSVLSQSSKYILAFFKKHIFNPAALALVLTALAGIGSASWWIGTSIMLPFTIIGGFLIVKKIRRFSLLWSFFVTSLFVIISSSFLKGENLPVILRQVFLDSPFIFFSTIMLTEPLTTPPTQKLQMIYGGLVGLLFAPDIHLGSLYSTPEISLIVGNIFSYIVSPKQKLLLKLKEKKQIASNTYDFIFEKVGDFKYYAGQYLEWTLPIKNPDTRGNRRYFTLASSPTENQFTIGVKFYPNGSTFKKVLMDLKPNDEILAGQLSGDFTLPEEKDKKLVFIAGGIGVTPFRSMIKYLEDQNQKRDIILFYSNNTKEDIAYSDVFDNAQNLGIKTIYLLTDKEKVPSNWQGEVGFLDENLIKQKIPDFKDRTFYISGPHTMVDIFQKTLGKLIPQNQIKVDFFPGYA